jgi:hypothetical protein
LRELRNADVLAHVLGVVQLAIVQLRLVHGRRSVQPGNAAVDDAVLRRVLGHAELLADLHGNVLVARVQLRLVHGRRLLHRRAHGKPGLRGEHGLARLPDPARLLAALHVHLGWRVDVVRR